MIVTRFLFTDHSLAASPTAECGKDTGYQEKAGCETSKEAAPYMHC